MKTPGVCAALSGFVFAVVFAVAVVGCGREDGGKQRATELSSDQPLSPTPLPTESQPEAPAQTEEDVAAARAKAEETRSQVKMATNVAKAQSAHRIRVEKCDSLPGEERIVCVAEADRELEAAKRQEKQRLETSPR